MLWHLHHLSGEPRGSETSAPILSSPYPNMEPQNFILWYHGTCEGYVCMQQNAMPAITVRRRRRKESLHSGVWGRDKRWFAQVLPAEGDGGGVYSLTNVWTSHLCVW